MTHLEELESAVASNNAVVMLGTGFSSAIATDKTNASWIGLLQAGVEYLKENQLASDAVCASIETDIYLGATESGSFLLNAGQKLSDQMKRPTSLHFGSFLDATVGKLEVDPNKLELAQRVEALELPVLTTNYDNLYEKAVGKPSATWRDPKKFRSAALNSSNDVIHLHGIWDNPDTVILTSRDYERIIRDSVTTTLREAVGVLKSIIFVGYGAGLTDPHFEQLWEWLSPLLPHGVKHYILCREEEVADLNTANIDRPIVALAYGTNYADLPVFIASITPARDQYKHAMEDPRTLARVAETCRLQILDQLVATSVMPWVIEDDDQDYGVEDLVIEPIFFPVPVEQYAAERSAGNKEIKPLNPTNEVLNGDGIIVIGEEQSGVSTALAWAALLRSEGKPTTIPIYLDYKQIGQGNHRVQNAIRFYLRSAGAPIGRKQPLPSDLVVAIDNVTAANDNDLLRTVEDLHKNVDSSLVVLGCRPSAEAWIQARFTELGSSILPAYLGRLNRHKTIELAKRADPDHAEHLADRVLKIARKEGLTRTPLCLMLLIVGTVNDDAWIKAVSHTTFLDSFIDSLLGRGSFQDDMHLQIDSTGYSMVLEMFAKKLIEDDSANVGWVETVSFIEKIVQRVDWSDNSSDILHSLITKGLLVNRDGQVQFRQHVYLHIFAARKCRSDDLLLDKLQNRPLYYASVLRHYAALQRDDIELLRWAVNYAQELSDISPSGEGIFRILDSTELVAPVKALESKRQIADNKDSDENPNALAGTEAETTPSAMGGEEPGLPSPSKNRDNNEEHGGDGEFHAGREFDEYDIIFPAKRTPFPAHDLDSAKLEVKLIPKLSLVSNILRDSELVQDATLKQDALVRVLRGWGLLMGTLYESKKVLRTG